MFKYDWQFNVMGVYNYKKPGKLDCFFKFIRDNYSILDGDIAEAGCFRGRSLLATAMLLKELGSNKIVFGYDTFEGFPPVYHKNDEFSAFEKLYKERRITEEHWAQILTLRDYKSNLFSTDIKNVSNISTSGNFSDTSIADLKKKIKYLNLDNIRLIQGDFNSTMFDNSPEPKLLMASLVDCDLYNSYKICLPFLWKKTVENGYMYIDEYYSLKFPGARIATDDYFSSQNIGLVQHSSYEGDFERWGVFKKQII